MTPPEASDTRYLKAGDLLIDRAREAVFVDGKDVDLRGRNYAVLLMLMERAPALLSKDEILDTVWKNVAVTEGALTTAIKTIRQAIGDIASDARLIETRYGRGYQFTAAVQATNVQRQPAEASPAKLSTIQLLSRRGGLYLLVAGLTATLLAVCAALFWPDYINEEGNGLQVVVDDEIATLNHHIEREFLSAGLTTNDQYLSRFKIELKWRESDGRTFVDQYLFDRETEKLIDLRPYPLDLISEADFSLRLAVENANNFSCLGALGTAARDHGLDPDPLASDFLQFCRTMSFPDRAHDPAAIAQRMLNEAPNEPFLKALFALAIFAQQERFSFGRSVESDTQLRALARNLVIEAEAESPASDFVSTVAVLARLNNLSLDQRLEALSQITRTDHVGMYAMLQRATLLRQAGRISEATYVAERYLVSLPYDRHATIAYALSAYASGRPARAYNALRSYLELYPEQLEIERLLRIQTLFFGPETARTELLEVGLPESFDELLACFELPQQAPLTDRQIHLLIQSCNRLDLVFAARQLARSGETSLALDMLESIEREASGISVIFYYPEFQAVRQTDRFAAIAEAFGLINVWRNSVLPDFCFESAEIPVCVQASSI